MDNFRYKKKFGQNFLKNEEILTRIANVISYQKDALVVEVGPGSGALTKKLQMLVKQVLCYEIDTELEDALARNLGGKENIVVVFDDFLKRNLEDDLANFSYEHLYFVSNVPYYITTPILFKLLDSHLPFEEIVMMVQKEIGDRLGANVGKKEYGALTVLLNYYFHVKKCFVVDSKNFIPSPKVDSIVVSFQRKENLTPLKSEEVFHKLVQDSFRFKRKTLRNNLKEYPLEKIEPILNSHHFSLTTRAEQIPVEVFVEIANCLEGN